MAISAFFSAAVKSTEELRTLIGAEDAGLAMTGKRFLDRFHADRRLQSDRQPPGQDASAEPVHDGGEKDGTLEPSECRPYPSPDLVGPGYGPLTQQIGIDLVLGADFDVLGGRQTASVPVFFIIVATCKRPVCRPSTFKRLCNIRLPANWKSRCSSSVRRIKARPVAGVVRGRECTLPRLKPKSLAW